MNRNLTILAAMLMAITLQAQDKALTTGVYFSNYYLNGGDPFTGAIPMENNANGSGSFEGGTYVYTTEGNNDMRLVEDVDGLSHNPVYLGAMSPDGQFATFIGDPEQEQGIAASGMMKLSSGKTNANFEGDYITSYYRYTNSSNYFMGLFQVHSDGIDSCVYTPIITTEAVDDEGFDYIVTDSGTIALFNTSGQPVIAAGINAGDDVYMYGSMVDRAAFGYGMKVPDIYNIEDLAGSYKAMQLRHSTSYNEESASILTLTLNTDSTGTYSVDTNSHGETTTGTIHAIEEVDGIWEIILDEDPDLNMFCAINPTNRVMTGYFIHHGSPGILFAIDNTLQVEETFTLSGTVSGANEVIITASGDISASDTIDAGEEYQFTVTSGQEVILTPSKAGYRFTPPQITHSNILSDMPGYNFTATPVNALEGNVAGGYKVYPNPVKDQLVVEAMADSKIQLLDLSGKQISSNYCPASELIIIDLSTQASGIYLLQLTNEQGIWQRKLVKQ